MREEQRYEKSIEVDQKTKQITLERNLVEQILTDTLPAAGEEAKVALAEITVDDCEEEILKNSTVPEAIQVGSTIPSLF